MNNVHLFFDVYIEDAELGVYLRGDRVRFNKDKKIRGRNTQYRYQTKLDITRYTLYSYSHIDWTSVTIRIFCENDEHSWIYDEIKTLFPNAKIERSRSDTGKIFLEALNKLTVPEKEITKVISSSRSYLLFWLVIISISIYFNSWLPIIMVILPPFYGNTILMICGMTQHAGLADNVKDHRKSTRTVILNPFFSFLYSNMEYHIEHHIFPKIPCHNLKKLHEVVKDQMPPPLEGVFNAYKSIIPAIFKQAKNKNYFIDVQIPNIKI